MGRFGESLTESKSALNVAALDVSVVAHLGAHYRMARQNAQALEAIRKALEIDPNHHLPLNVLGQIYTDKRMYPEAIETHRKAIASSKGSTIYLAALGYAYASAGKRNDAEQ